VVGRIEQMRRNHRRFITSPKTGEERSDSFITVVLLSEKIGHRMKSYGPLPLLKIGKYTLIDLQISAIKSAFTNFELIVCCGFGCEKVVRYIRDHYPRENIRVVENQIHQHSNCCESTRLCLNNTNSSNILLCNGSLVFGSDIMSLIERKHSHILSETKKVSNLEVGFTDNDEDFVENFSYGVNNIWSEIVFFNNSYIIEEFSNIVSGIYYKNKFLFEALNELIRRKHSIRVVRNDQHPIFKIDNIKTYHTVRRSNEGIITKLCN